MVPESVNKKIKREEYNSLGDMRKDLDLLVTNCRTFNEETSGICQDANTIEVSTPADPVLQK